jgi:Leucine-rich repeat (LRR) protein
MMNKLPSGLTALSRLRSLKLTHNKLSWVPAAELQQLPGLEELQLAGNLIKVR